MAVGIAFAPAAVHVAVLEPGLDAHYEYESAEECEHRVMGIYPAMLAFLQCLREEEQEQQAEEYPCAECHKEMDLSVGQRLHAGKIRSGHRYGEYAQGV